MSHRSYVLSQREVPLSATWLKGWRWHRPPKDDRHLNDFRPILKGGHDVIILGGWDEPTYLLLWLYGVFLGKKIVFWIESTAYDKEGRGYREVLKRFLLRYAAGCIVPGKRAFEYCRSLGVPEGSIFVAPNATDRSFFGDQALRLNCRRAEISSIRRTDGVSILFVGRLTDQYKNVSTLIDAFGRITRHGSHANLMIAGDGPDKDLYEKMAQEQGDGRIHFYGELNHQELCRLYAAADFFVLPSRSEPWGFVLNEAMEFGLPLVVSEAVGAGPDLVHPGENGFVFPVGDSKKLAEILEMLIKDEPLRKRMGQASRRIIQDFTPEAWAQGVVKAIEAVTGKTVNSQ
jgi:glycosyltransferase involved in cell wall biosynthesis